MQNKHTFDFSDKALRDLKNILDYIENKLHNQKAAKDLSNKIFECIDSACLFPESCAKIDNELVLDQGLRKIYIDNYKLIYKIEEEKKNLIIIRIIYAKMDMKAIYSSLLK